MIIKREDVIGYVDVKNGKHICFKCFEDTDIENLTVLMENQLKDEEGCICDNCKTIMW